jgi:hypothetical protein
VHKYVWTIRAVLGVQRRLSDGRSFHRAEQTWQSDDCFLVRFRAVFGRSGTDVRKPRLTSATALCLVLLYAASLEG